MGEAGGGEGMDERESLILRSVHLARVSKDEAGIVAMVRDGASAPPHHEGK
jgi:hypothetical protein